VADHLRVLIVDDEPPARSRLRRLLASHPDVIVVGEAADGLEALAMTETLRPHALLLDVQMPELDGLDVAASLPDSTQGGPAVIFVTAFDAYAVPAFDAAAVDYVLKPVDPARLARALQRLRAGRPAAATRPAPRRLVVDVRGQMLVIDCSSLVWLQAADNYVELYTADRMHLLRRTLDSLLADLGTGFVRVHRSRAVALSSVRSLASTERGSARALLSNGASVGCSPAGRLALEAALQAVGSARLE
jgi:two-component system LytT family response regulator